MDCPAHCPSEWRLALSVARLPPARQRAARNSTPSSSHPGTSTARPTSPAPCSESHDRLGSRTPCASTYPPGRRCLGLPCRACLAGVTRRRLRERATKAEPAATISAPLSTKRHALNPVTARAGVPDEEEVAATVVTAVAGVMVMVAALLVAVPPALVKTALTSQPFTRAVRDPRRERGRSSPREVGPSSPAVDRVLPLHGRRRGAARARREREGSTRRRRLAGRLGRHRGSDGRDRIADHHFAVAAVERAVARVRGVGHQDKVAAGDPE
jgi:hypothetical protein